MIESCPDHHVSPCHSQCPHALRSPTHRNSLDYSVSRMFCPRRVGMVSKRRFACFEMALSEGDEGYSLVPHQGTGPIRLREVRRSSMGCNIEAIKPFVKQGPLRLVRCLAERQTSRHLSKRLLPIVLFTLEEFVMLDVWSLAKLAHSYLLTIDYRVVGRAVACLFSCVLTGASRDKLCRIFTTAWRNFGRALMWLKWK